MFFGCGMDGNPQEVSIMDWKLHVILSFLLYFLIISFFQFSVSYSVQSFLILVFFSLFPDIDHRKSMIRKAVFILVFYLMVLFVFIGMNLDAGMKILIVLILSVLTYYLYKFLPLKHRGKRSLHLWRYFFVSLMLFTVLFALANINISLTLFIIVGYGSHLISDKIREF
jgi:hypothetical protein